MKLSVELRAALEDMPSDITVAQARLAVIAKYIPPALWEELSGIEGAHGAGHPLKSQKYRSIDGEPDLPPLPSPPPVPPKPEFTCVGCGGANVSERDWTVLNPPIGWRLGQSLHDADAYDCVDHQFYCHDCEEIFNEIERCDQ